jgi:hypothetical protein
VADPEQLYRKHEDTVKKYTTTDLNAAAKRQHDTAWEAVRLAQETKRQRLTIADRWDLGYEEKKKGTDIAMTIAVCAMQDIRSRFDDARNEYNAALEQLTSPYREKATDAAGEMRRQAGWARLKAQLDALPGNAHKSLVVQDMLDTAFRLGDTALLEAARRELPGYLASHNETLHEPLALWLDIQAGPPESVEAREMEAKFAETNTRALLAVRLASKLERREMPGVLPAVTYDDMIEIDGGVDPVYQPSGQYVAGPPAS